MKSVSGKATMSPLVRKLLDTGHRPKILSDGRIKIGDHIFRAGKRTHVVRRVRSPTD